MMILYVKTGCPYCAKVIEKLKKLDIPYEEKNIRDPVIARELIGRGGKRQVPYMDDEDPCSTAGHHTPCLLDDDVEMYESDKIVAYLEENYGKEDSPKRGKLKNMHLHRDTDENVCDGCE